MPADIFEVFYKDTVVDSSGLPLLIGLVPLLSGQLDLIVQPLCFVGHSHHCSPTWRRGEIRQRPNQSKSFADDRWKVFPITQSEDRASGRPHWAARGRYLCRARVGKRMALGAIEPAEVAVVLPVSCGARIQ